MVKSSSALNHVPNISDEHVFIRIPLIAGDTPADGVKQHTVYHSYFKRRMNNQNKQATP